MCVREYVCNVSAYPAHPGHLVDSLHTCIPTNPASLLLAGLVYTVQCETPERSALDDLGFGLAATALGRGALHGRRDQVDSLPDMRPATCAMLRPKKAV